MTDLHRAAPGAAAEAPSIEDAAAPPADTGDPRFAAFLPAFCGRHPRSAFTSAIDRAHVRLAGQDAPVLWRFRAASCGGTGMGRAAAAGTLRSHGPGEVSFHPFGPDATVGVVAGRRAQAS